MPLTILEAIQERRHGDYWANRARQNQRRAEKIASDMLKREKQLYNEMYKKLEALIAEVQNEVLFDGGVASRTQLWRYAKYQQLEKELRDMTQTTIRRQKTLMDEGMERVFEETIETSMAKVAGRSAGFNVVSPGMSKKYINTAWAGENYSTRIWKNMNALASHLRDDMADMIVLGRSPADIRRKLREDFNVGFYEADRLARTEANHVYNSAAIEGYRRNGVKKVNILIGRKEGTCSRCHKYADHGEYLIDEAPTLPAHPFCGCCYTPVVDWDDWDDEDENAGLTGGGEDGIISSYRMVGMEPPEPMPQMQLDKIRSAFSERGGIIQISADTDAYLQRRGAEAITYDANTILLRQNSGRAAVFEELIHSDQFRRGLNDGSIANRLRCEIDAQKKLIRNRKAYKLTESEIKQTERALRQYEKELADYLQGGG